MSAAFRFDPVELPPACAALRAEVPEFIAGELAAGLWVPNSDFGSHRSALIGWRSLDRRPAERAAAIALLHRGAAACVSAGHCAREISFCIGMSEPDAGSDLASILARAVRVAGGDEVTRAKV